MTDATANFGFEEIPAAEKEGRVGGVFSSVAADYDRMNDAMSLGIHRLWKDRLIREIRPRDGEAFLDVAGGTGDIAFRIQDSVRAKGGDADITVFDINAEMLAEGRRRAEGAGRDDLVWLEGNAQDLKLPDSSFDCYSIAFGIRNVTDIPMALREAHRVLKRGGRFYCLEFSAAVLPALKPFYEAYSFAVIPRLGQAIAGDKASYQYLVESIRTHPRPPAFSSMMAAAGFGRVRFDKLSAGIVTIHSGWKL